MTTVSGFLRARFFSRKRDAARAGAERPDRTKEPGVTKTRGNLDGLAIALICASVALAAGGIAAAFAIDKGGGITSLVRLPAEGDLGKAVQRTEPDFQFVDLDTGYDGRYFFAIALDPFARGTEHGLIDSPAYRYGHVAYGWSAGLLAWGDPDLVPYALLALSLAGIAVSAFALSRLAAEHLISPWWGLAAAMNPGLIYAVTTDTSEAFGAGVVGAGLLLWLRKHLWSGAALLLLASLTKEPFVLVPIGLMGWEFVQRIRGDRDKAMWFRLELLAVSPLALVTWFVYLTNRIGEWPFASGPKNLGVPVFGWVDTLGRAAGLAQEGDAFQVGQASLPLLIVAGVAVLTTVFAAARIRTPLHLILLLHVPLIAMLTWLALLFPKDLLRNLSLFLYLLPFAFIPRHRSEGEPPA